ncbi:helix-turn-helix domain-containing protein (plasmid) [Nostoc sp. UHCC 0926]|uniref:helix-turn-helix domain-containing protein n=1 Tax=Nostoc sp. UHCC 0926 TaxID=3025190 RepID=UPI002360738D|nr:helix-turn-helix domain-containing protein [Nostoc sp. UHCC 0926]WDD30213.1 helix-turn-helix domain-containing protein [Nostoc sp. UHCC 0926]
MTTEIDKPKNLLFIHSSVDDAGLTPNEFRLICHFARRGVCYSSLEKMAYVTELSVRTIQKTLKFLVEGGLVIKKPKPGHPDIYHLPDFETFAKRLDSGKLKERKEMKKKEYEEKEKKRKLNKEASTGLMDTPQSVKTEEEVDTSPF